MALECPLCKSDEESIDHLFLHCKRAAEIWSICMAWWGVSWCVSNCLPEWAAGWFGLCPLVRQGRAWNALFFAIIWTIWESRNNMVFRNSDLVVSHAIDIIKFRVAWWFKYHTNGCSDSVTVLIQNVAERCLVSKPRKFVSAVEWSPPYKGLSNLTWMVRRGEILELRVLEEFCGILKVKS